MDLEIRAQPRAKRNAVEVGDGGRVVVRVTAPPEGGKANEAVIALLAKGLGIAKRSIELVRGHTARTKLVRIEGLSKEEVMARLSGK